MACGPENGDDLPPPPRWINWVKVGVPLSLFLVIAWFYPFSLSPHPLPPPVPALESVTAQNFRFENYSGNEAGDMIEAVKKIVPIGMPKRDVDKLLVGQDGAKAVTCCNNSRRVFYKHDPRKDYCDPSDPRCYTFNVTDLVITYTADDKVQSIGFVSTVFKR